VQFIREWEPLMKKDGKKQWGMYRKCRTCEDFWRTTDFFEKKLEMLRKCGKIEFRNTKKSVVVPYL